MLSLLGNISIVLPIILPGLGSALGQARINKAALKAIDIQPQAYTDIARINLIGCAITETAAILGFILPHPKVERHLSSKLDSIIFIFKVK